MKDEAGNKDELKKYSRELGLSLFGIADITDLRKEFHLNPELADKFHRGVSIGKSILDPVLDDIEDRPTQLYFHHYRQLNYFLDRAALIISSFIQELGYSSLPIPASQVIDWENQRGHLSHKKVGLAAGLGWIGRNNLLINPKFGARFRLVTVLTDMPLIPDEVLENNCGSCRKCLKTCPARAIKEQKELFDHLACFEKLREFRRSGIVSQYICGVCVKACSGRKNL